MFPTGVLYQKTKILTILKLYETNEVRRSSYEMQKRPPDFYFTSESENIKNTFYNLALVTTQGRSHYGKLLSDTQTFFSNFDNKQSFAQHTPWFQWLFLEKLLEIFQKNKTLTGGSQGETRKLMSKIKEDWFYCSFGQWFLVWETKWCNRYFLKDINRATTIRTIICSQTSI